MLSSTFYFKVLYGLISRCAKAAISERAECSKEAVSKNKRTNHDVASGEGKETELHVIFLAEKQK